MQNKVILITGAARRIGAAMARYLHQAGARVVLHYRHHGEEARLLMCELNQLRPDSAALVQADLLNMLDLTRLAQQSMACFDRLDGLVNNASSFFPTAIGEIDEFAWQDLMGSNLKAPLFLIQALAPELRARQGAIVNIVDIHALRPMRGYPVYSIAKAGLLALTQSMAVELAPHIRVNGVAPGPIAWPEGEGAISSVEQARVIAHTLLKRSGCPEDIAKAVKFLLADAPFITGQILAVDGGRSVNV
jgi:pteridine reductase